MHATASSNFTRFINCYSKYFNKPKIIDIGSCNVNGCLKDLIRSECEYTGVDIVAGSNVDVVLTEPYKYPFENDTFDIAISNSCFEHNEMFWLSFMEIMRILKPKGIFYLCAPATGEYHRHPQDCWRFYPDSSIALTKWAKYNNINAVTVESFVTYKEGGLYNDFVSVFLKDESYIGEITEKTTDSYHNFANGNIHGKNGVINLDGNGWITK